jgi:hypothetical protein
VSLTSSRVARNAEAMPWFEFILINAASHARRTSTLRLLPGSGLALFLPFADAQARFGAAHSSTTLIIVRTRFHRVQLAIRQVSAWCCKIPQTVDLSPVNRRVAGSNLPAAAVAAGYAAAPCSWCRNARTSSWSAIRERADARRIRREDTSTDHRPAAYRSAAVTSIITTGTDSSAGTPSRAAPRWRTATV